MRQKPKSLNGVGAPVTLLVLANSLNFLRPFISELELTANEPDNQLQAAACFRGIWNRFFTSRRIVRTPLSRTKDPASIQELQPSVNTNTHRETTGGWVTSARESSAGWVCSARRLFRKATPDERLQLKCEKLFGMLNGQIDRRRLHTYCMSQAAGILSLDDVALPHWRRRDSFANSFSSQLTDDLRSVEPCLRVKAIQVLFDKMWVFPSKKRDILNLPSAEEEVQVLKDLAKFNPKIGFNERSRSRLMRVYPFGGDRIPAACRLVVYAVLQLDPKRDYQEIDYLKDVMGTTNLASFANDGASDPTLFSCLSLPNSQCWSDVVRLIAIGFQRLNPHRIEEICKGLLHNTRVQRSYG